MKWLVLVTVTAFSANSFALDRLPDGNWVGQGRYSSDNGPKGGYMEKVAIQDNVVTAELEIEGKTITIEAGYTFKENGFVDVAIADKARNRTFNASGYCASVWCHIESTDPNVKFEMTFVTADDNLFELGSSTEQGVKNWFESALKKVK